MCKLYLFLIISKGKVFICGLGKFQTRKSQKKIGSVNPLRVTFAEGPQIEQTISVRKFAICWSSPTFAYYTS